MDDDLTPGCNPIDLDDIPEEFFMEKGECADLANADLRAYNLPRFDFKGANMRKAKFPWLMNAGTAKSRQMICGGKADWCASQ